MRKGRSIVRNRLAVLAFAFVFAAEPLLSCPVCFGETESGSAAGVNAAVWVLLGITAVVLGLLSAMFLHFRRRMRMTLGGDVQFPGSN